MFALVWRCRGRTTQRSTKTPVSMQPTPLSTSGRIGGNVSEELSADYPGTDVFTFHHGAVMYELRAMFEDGEIDDDVRQMTGAKKFFTDAKATPGTLRKIRVCTSGCTPSMALIPWTCHARGNTRLTSVRLPRRSSMSRPTRCSNGNQHAVIFKVDIFLPDFCLFSAKTERYFRKFQAVLFLIATLFQRFCTPTHINGVRRGMQCIQSVWGE